MVNIFVNVCLTSTFSYFHVLNTHFCALESHTFLMRVLHCSLCVDLTWPIFTAGLGESCLNPTRTCNESGTVCSGTSGTCVCAPGYTQFGSVCAIGNNTGLFPFCLFLFLLLIAFSWGGVGEKGRGRCLSPVFSWTNLVLSLCIMSLYMQ